jgi:hypothetical protein
MLTFGRERCRACAFSQTVSRVKGIVYSLIDIPSGMFRIPIAETIRYASDHYWVSDNYAPGVRRRPIAVDCDAGHHSSCHEAVSVLTMSKARGDLTPFTSWFPSLLILAAKSRTV